MILVLNLNADDETAVHCKVICLIQLTQFKEALQFIQSKNLTDKLTFEKAYSEYRLNKPSLALSTIDSLGLKPHELPINLKELRAQILYRLELYQECFEAYNHIIKNTDDDYDVERRTNLAAVRANLEVHTNQNKLIKDNINEEKQSKQLSTELPDATTYEQYFNYACLLCNQGNYIEAEKKLRQCEKLCREFLANEEDDDEATTSALDNDIREELAVIEVQIAYCLQKQGKIDQAAEIYIQILRNKPKDPILVAVASNNMVVMNKERHIFDSKKKIRLAMTDVCEHKLTNFQKQAVALNNCLISYLSNVNYKQIQQLSNELCCKYPSLSLNALLIQVSQLVKEKNFNEAINLLQKSFTDKKNIITIVNQSKTNQLQNHKTKEYQYSEEELTAIKFAIIQLLLMQNNRKEAIKMFLSLNDDCKYKPGVVSTLVSLYQSMKCKDDAANLLKDAVEWYKRKNLRSNNLPSIFHNAADFYLQQGKMESASDCLEELLKLYPNDMKVIARLVIAYADHNPKRAQEFSVQLPPLQTLTVAVEIDALEAANWVMSAKAKKYTKEDPSPGLSTGGTPAVTATGKLVTTSKKKKRNRKRKIVLPKNYNADVPPDPERWLPKYERTGFRKKRDRRAKDIIKGSQGLSSYAADQL